MTCMEEADDAGRTVAVDAGPIAADRPPQGRSMPATTSPFRFCALHAL